MGLIWVNLNTYKEDQVIPKKYLALGKPVIMSAIKDILGERYISWCWWKFALKKSYIHWLFWWYFERNKE